MSYRLPGSAEEDCANRSVFSQFATVIAAVFFLLLLTACSGISVPGNGNTSSATNSTPGLTISTLLPSATVGSSYNATLNVSGGTLPYAFTLASGQLPAGVLLSSATGTLSGTPTSSGSFSFAISVSDSKGLSKQQSLQMTVAAAPITNRGNSFSNLQNSAGWGEYGQGPPDFVDCSPSPCDGISF